jgi:hypothetical protein
VRAYALKIPVARSRALLVEGHLAVLQGRSSAAIGPWRRGLAAAEHLAMPLDAELCATALRTVADLPGHSPKLQQTAKLSA